MDLWWNFEANIQELLQRNFCTGQVSLILELVNNISMWIVITVTTTVQCRFFFTKFNTNREY